MKAVSDNFLTQFSVTSGPSDGAFGSQLLDKIGDDLRHVYGDLTDSELPHHLLDLAQAIDSRRVGEPSDE